MVLLSDHRRIGSSDGQIAFGINHGFRGAGVMFEIGEYENIGLLSHSSSDHGLRTKFESSNHRTTSPICSWFRHGQIEEGKVREEVVGLQSMFFLLTYMYMH